MFCCCSALNSVKAMSIFSKVRRRLGITYHNIKSLASHLGKDVCGALPDFHALTGSDYTQPFYGRSKFKALKK